MALCAWNPSTQEAEAIFSGFQANLNSLGRQGLGAFGRPRMGHATWVVGDKVQVPTTVNSAGGNQIYFSLAPARISTRRTQAQQRGLCLIFKQGEERVAASFARSSE